MTKRVIAYLFICLYVVLSLGACHLLSSNQDQEDPLPLEPVKKSTGDVEDLVDYTWSLVTHQNNNGDTLNINEKKRYEITFTPSDSIRGTTECNSFYGLYDVQDGGQINIRDKFSSHAFCGENESKYQATILRKVNIFEISHDSLKLGFEDKGVILYRKE